MTELFVPVVRQLPLGGRDGGYRRRGAARTAARTRRRACWCAWCRFSCPLGSLGVMAAAFFSGPAVTRNPTFLAFPMMMLISMAVRR